MPIRFCTQCGAELVAPNNACVVCEAALKRDALSRQDVLLPKAKKPAAQRRRVSRLLLGALGAVMVLSALVVIYWVTAQPPAIVSEIPDVHDEQGVPFPDVPRISAVEAKARYDTGTALFVDVRDQEAYAAAHIPDALSLPLQEFETSYQTLPQGAEIITYCT